MKGIGKFLASFGIGALTFVFVYTLLQVHNPAPEVIPAPDDIIPTDAEVYDLRTYLRNNLQIEASELTCSVPNYNTHGGFEGTYETTVDILGYVEVPKDFPEVSSVPKDVNVYAVALPKTIEYEVPQRPGIVDNAPDTYVPILLIRDDVDRGISVCNSYGAGFPYYVMNTETHDVFRSSIYALSDAKTLDDAVNNSTFRISCTDAVTYGIAEAPTNIRVNPKAQ